MHGGQSDIPKNTKNEWKEKTFTKTNEDISGDKRHNQTHGRLTDTFQQSQMSFLIRRE